VERSDTHRSGARACVKGPFVFRQGAASAFSWRWIAPRHPNHAKRYAARRGSQSAYKASQRFTIATSASEFSRRARRFKPATLKAVFSVEWPAMSHAARDIRCTRDVRRDSTAAAAAAGVVFPREAANFSRAHLFKLRSGESRGRDGREACAADICRTISDGSE